VYPSPTPDRTLLARAANKDKAAERREAEARRMRAEAAELRTRWEQRNRVSHVRRSA
jgi:hypothetical protein